MHTSYSASFLSKSNTQFECTLQSWLLRLRVMYFDTKPGAHIPTSELQAVYELVVGPLFLRPRPRFHALLQSSLPYVVEPKFCYPSLEAENSNLHILDHLSDNFCTIFWPFTGWETISKHLAAVRSGCDVLPSDSSACTCDSSFSMSLISFSVFLISFIRRFCWYSSSSLFLLILTNEFRYTEDRPLSAKTSGRSRLNRRSAAGYQSLILYDHVPFPFTILAAFKLLERLSQRLAPAALCMDDQRLLHAASPVVTKG